MRGRSCRSLNHQLEFLHYELNRISINIGCQVGGLEEILRAGGQQWQGNLARLMGLLARAALLSKNLNL